MPDDKPTVRTVADVARMKGVTRFAVYGALDRGTLSEQRVSETTRLVVCDDKLDAYLAAPIQPNRKRS